MQISPVAGSLFHEKEQTTSAHIFFAQCSFGKGSPGGTVCSPRKTQNASFGLLAEKSRYQRMIVAASFSSQMIGPPYTILAG